MTAWRTPRSPYTGKEFPVYLPILLPPCFPAPSGSFAPEASQACPSEKRIGFAPCRLCGEESVGGVGNAQAIPVTPTPLHGVYPEC